MLFYGFATYGNAGWMREQVCKYMCPYARFQSVMFDQDTLIITYDAGAASRAARAARRSTRKAAGLGDCVDCGICVQVCPTGIDIRKGLQYECIGCAACIDGCDQVMDKMGYPQGLIRYSTENALAQGLRHARRCGGACSAPRTLIYTGAARDHRRRRRRLAVPAQPAQGRRDPRPRRAGARGGARRDRERLPAADHEHRRDAARSSRSPRDGLPGTQGRRRRAAAAARRRVVAAGAAAPAGAGRRRARRRATATRGAASHKVEFVVEAIGDPQGRAAREIDASCFRARLRALRTDDRPCHVRSATARDALVPPALALAADRRAGDRRRRRHRHARGSP